MICLKTFEKTIDNKKKIIIQDFLGSGFFESYDKVITEDEFNNLKFQLYKLNDDNEFEKIENYEPTFFDYYIKNNNNDNDDCFIQATAVQTIEASIYRFGEIDYSFYPIDIRFDDSNTDSYLIITADDDSQNDVMKLKGELILQDWEFLNKNYFSKEGTFSWTNTSDEYTADIFSIIFQLPDDIQVEDNSVTIKGYFVYDDGQEEIEIDENVVSTSVEPM